MASTPTSTTVDDNDTGLISYDSDWTVGKDTTLGWYSGTLHYSQKLGSSARFTFTGTAVYVYGVFDNDHGDYTVSIGSFTTPHLSSYAASRANDRLLLSATCLPLAQYTVTLTNQDPVLWTNLDRIVYSSDAANCDTGIVYTGPSYNFVTGSTSSIPSGTFGSTTGPSTGSPTGPSTNTGSQTPNPGNKLGESQSLGAGPIAGIVVGVVVAGLLAIIAFFLWKRHKRQQQAENPPAATAWTGPSAAATGANPHYTGQGPVMQQSHNALGYVPPDQLDQRWAAGGVGAVAGIKPLAGAGRAPMVVESYGGGHPGPYYQQPPIAPSSANATVFTGSSTHLNHPSTPPLPPGAGVPDRSTGVMSPPPEYQYPSGRRGPADDKQLLRDLQEKVR